MGRHGPVRRDDPVSLSQSYLPRAWAPSSVRAVLHNEAYRGMSVWSHL